MRLLVCGGRDFNDKMMMAEHLDNIHAARPVTLLIHGDARGADTLAKEWAEARGIKTQAFPADWTAHGKAAGPIRNTRMLTEGLPDMVVAFPGGSGTANMVDQSKRAGVRTRIIGAEERTMNLFGE